MLKKSPINRQVFFMIQYLIQSIALMFMPAPLYFVFRGYQNQKFYGLLEWNFIAMCVISSIGIIGQAISDQRLQNYKHEKYKNPDYKLAVEKLRREKNDQKKKLEEQDYQKNGSGQGDSSTNNASSIKAADPEIQTENSTKPNYQPSKLTKQNQKTNIVSKKLESKIEEFPNIYNKGIWSISRHPNLFFEIIYQIGLAIGGLNDYTISFMGFIGVFLLWCLMNFLTIPATEKYMGDTRPNYDDFRKKTNRWLPIRICFCIKRTKAQA